MTDPKYAAEEWARVARDPLRANDTDEEPWPDRPARVWYGTLAALCLLAVAPQPETQHAAGCCGDPEPHRAPQPDTALPEVPASEWYRRGYEAGRKAQGRSAAFDARFEHPEAWYVLRALGEGVES